MNAIEVKSSKKSRKILTEANNLLQLLPSIGKYNEALRFAETDQDLALIYEKRWETAVALEAHQSAIRNIELAQSHKHPSVNKMKKAKNLCQRILEDTLLDNESLTKSASSSGDREFLQLSYESNPKIPWIVNCLELKEDEKKGRHIITTKDLKVGDIIWAEISPNTSIFDDDQRTMQCLNCLQFAPLTLIPCPGCTSVMFCSQECLDAAKFHLYECKVISKVLNAPKELLAEWPSVRLLMKAIAAYDGKIGKMCEFFEANEGKTVFDFDFSDPSDPEYMKNYALASYHSKIDDKFFASLESQRTIASQFKAILKEVPSINNAMMKCVKCRSFILKFLVQVLVGSQEVSDSNGLLYVGCSPITLLFQHSCAPNTESIRKASGLCVRFVTFPIKANEAVTYSRDETFDETSLYFRRLEFKQQFNEDCSCRACIVRYPTLMKMKSTDKKLLKQIEFNLNRKEMHSEKRLKLIDEYGAFLNENKDKYPTKVISAQKHRLTGLTS